MGRKFSVVGKSMPDVSGVAKVTGAAKFISDITLPGMLIGRVLHSPHAHARIVNIDTSKAERLPGVAAVITHKDVPNKLYSTRLMNFMTYSGIAGSGVYDEHVLGDKVRYVGDAVAALVAINEKVAEEALELIDVEYEPLPAVFDESESTKYSAPQIHDFVERRQADGRPGREAVERNLGVRVALKPVGDVERGFREADYIIEAAAYTSKQRNAPLETLHCIANFDADGKLTLWTQSQFPHVAKRLISYVFDMPLAMIRVKCEYIGGCFGVAIAAYKDALCVALAKKAGKPVKLIYTRQEEFTDRPTRACFRPYTIKMGIKRDGTIIATARKVISAAGAYVGAAAAEALVGMSVATKLYRCQNYSGEVDAIYTNKVPCGACRGFGNLEESFVREQLMDMAAEKMGTDPLEFRLKNLCRIGDPVFGPGLTPLTSTALAECIKIGAEKIGWKEKRNRKKAGTRRRGIGVSCMAHDSGAWPATIEPSSAFIKFNEDASIVLTVSVPPLGTNVFTSLAQVAAEVLGLRFDDVRVVWGDTDVTLWETGSHATRSMYAVGNAVQRAATEAREKLLGRAAKKLGVTPDELDIKDKRIYVKANPEKGIHAADVTKQATYSPDGEEAITGICRFVATNSPPPYQALFTEVEVDTETGELKVLKMVMVNDSGIVINPMAVEGQLQGGAAHGLGYALWEEPVMDINTGQVLTDDFDTYKIATTLDMPELELVLVEQPEPTGPFGAKGVGEVGAINVAASIANAIYNAVGVRIWELPITPEKVLKALLT